jgi:argonaute-like protein implicated in RNA metabolism and viral defense
MLFTIGCLHVGTRFRPTGLGTPSPILVSIKDIGQEKRLDDKTLVKSVFNICRMNYTSINNPVNRSPATVSYALDIAYMMGRLGIRQIPEEISRRPWFI